MIPGAPHPLLLAGGSDPIDELGVIARMLRLRASANGSLSRTPAVAGDRKVFTVGMFVKSGDPSVNTLLAAGDGTNQNYTTFSILNGRLTTQHIAGGSVVVDKQSARQLRDPAALEFVLFSYNNGVIRAFVWNDEITAWNTNTNTLGAANTFINAANLHTLGRTPYATNPGDIIAGWPFIVEGQALLPTAFIVQHPVTGQWRPKSKAQIKAVVDAGGACSTFPTFEDPTNTTTLCADASSHGSNWTSSNVSLTAGVTYDSMADGTDNVATLNPLDNGGGNTLSDANLSVANAATANNYYKTKATIPCKGKVYFEARWNGGGGIYVCTVGLYPTSVYSSDQTTGGDSSRFPNDIVYYSAYNGTSGYVVQNSASQLTGPSALAIGDIIQVAYDEATGKVWFGKNGTWWNSGNPAAGTGSIGTPCNAEVTPYVSCEGGASWSVNFGQRNFSYTPPSGFKAMSAKNLPKPKIPDATTAFVSATDSGANIVATLAAAATKIGNNWIKIYKKRSAAEGWRWVFSDDPGYALDSSSAGAGRFAFPAPSGVSYVGYALKVSAANGVATGRLAHINGVANTVTDGLGNIRKAIILTNEAGSAWYFYHPELTAGKLLYLNTPAGETPDATISSVLTNSFVVAASLPTGNYRWIAIPEIDGLLKLGKYFGNGVADGPMVSSGSLPMFFFEKRTDTTGDYYTYDSARNQYNGIDLEVDLNNDIAETAAGGVSVDFVSTGTKIRRSGTNINASGGVYVYLEISAFPFRYANAR